MKFGDDGFWRQIAAVLSGSVIAQVIPVLGSLIIARQFSPAEYGMYAVWLGISLLCSVAITGRFEMTLAMAPEGEDRHVAVIATLLTAGLGIAVIAFSLVVVNLIFSISIESISGWLAVALIPAAFFTAIAQTWQGWAAAEGNYRSLSLMRIGFASSITLSQILAGTVWVSATALSFAHVVGAFLGVLASIKAMPLKKVPEPLKPKILEFWGRYRRFPLVALPADAINTSAAQLPLVIVASRFGPEIAGYLALTLRTLGAPIGLLGKAVLDVFKRHAAMQWRRQGDCQEIYIRTFKVLLIGSLAVALALVLTGEEMFVVFFGARWREAGIIAIWLMPMFVLRFIASPLSYMFYLAEKQHLDLIWQGALLVMTLITLSFAKNYANALQLYSVGYSALYLIYLMMSRKLSRGVNQ